MEFHGCDRIEGSGSEFWGKIESLKPVQKIQDLGKGFGVYEADSLKLGLWVLGFRGKMSLSTFWA